MKKPDGICLPTFIANEFSGLILHPSIFSIKHSGSAWITNGALSDLWFWLNSKISVLQKAL